MENWHTVILCCILASADDSACVLLNHAEKKALRRQQHLIEDIRHRLQKNPNFKAEDLPIEELVSQSCHTLSSEELEVIATVVAACQSNIISKQAHEIALQEAHEHQAVQCEKLAEFWELTRTIGKLEIERFNLFDANE